jgi:photosynthetic reaction center cytochrome c subunit
VQRGYRGTQMGLVYNPRTVDAQQEMQTAPVPLKATPKGLVLGRAGDTYKSVQVLGDLDIAEFGRTMNAMTQWVSPGDGGCLYCHVEGDFAANDKYTKVVARRMLQMTRLINSQWTSHVGQTGVTCYTCHRGKPLPVDFWFTPVPQQAKFAGNHAGQNAPGLQVGLTALPGDPLTPFLVDAQSIRMQGSTALPTEEARSVKQTELTYGLMIHMTRALGVNCTFCHNSRTFASWAASPPQRATAWYGIRMVRQLNNEIFLTLGDVFPPNRLGELGDPPKASCATCHRGVYKPLNGTPMAPDYPGLLPTAAPAVVAAAAAR